MQLFTSAIPQYFYKKLALAGAAIGFAFSFAPAAAETVRLGASVKLHVTAEGAPARSIQWRKNGTAVAGVTGAVFSIPSATFGDSGSYGVTVTNDYGSAASPDFPLLVTVEGPIARAPVITSHPSLPETVGEGGFVSMSVSASGSPAPAYQWLKNGAPISGATNATLTLFGITTSDSASYAAVLSNIAGTTTSNPVTLLVAPIPRTLPPDTPNKPSDPSGPPPPDAPNKPSIPPDAPNKPEVPVYLAPVITSQPVALGAVTEGGTVSMTVAAIGSPAPAYHWLKNGNTVFGATNATLTLFGVRTTDSANYVGVASNIAGSAASAPVTLVVTAPPPPAPPPDAPNKPAEPVYLAPVITSQPVALGAVTEGGTVSMTVAAIGSPAPAYHWLKNGNTVFGATNATLTLFGVRTTDSANYVGVASNIAGSAASAPVTLVVTAPPPPAPPPDAPNKPAEPVYLAPVITSQPVALGAVTEGGTVSLTVAAIGSPTPTYHWLKNGNTIFGATNATLTLFGVTTDDSANYVGVASNIAGSARSSPVTVMVTAPFPPAPPPDAPNKPEEPPVYPPDAPNKSWDIGTISPEFGAASQIVSFSVRAKAGVGSSSLVVGFVTEWGTTALSSNNGTGPSLGVSGVTGAFLEPTLFLGNIAQNGAFRRFETGTNSSWLAALETGPYTVQVPSRDTGGAAASIDVFDATRTDPWRLINVSVRTHVGSAEAAPQISFVIAGTEAKRVLIRAVGPSLGVFGVTDGLADPQLELYRGNVRIGQNDDWGGSGMLVSAFAQTGAFPLDGGGSRDAALLVTLEPGDYTVVASGVRGSIGALLIEIYDVP